MAQGDGARRSKSSPQQARMRSSIRHLGTHSHPCAVVNRPQISAGIQASRVEAELNRIRMRGAHSRFGLVDHSSALPALASDRTVLAGGTPPPPPPPLPFLPPLPFPVLPCNGGVPILSHVDLPNLRRNGLLGDYRCEHSAVMMPYMLDREHDMAAFWVLLKVRFTCIRRVLLECKSN